MLFHWVFWTLPSVINRPVDVQLPDQEKTVSDTTLADDPKSLSQR